MNGEYAGLTKMLGGKVIKIKQGESAGINPFELEPDYEEKKQSLNIRTKVSEIRDLFSTICQHQQNRVLTSAETTAIEKIVKKLYAERGITDDVNSLYERKRWKTREW